MTRTYYDQHLTELAEQILQMGNPVRRTISSSIEVLGPADVAQAHCLIDADSDRASVCARTVPEQTSKLAASTHSPVPCQGVWPTLEAL